MALGRVSMAGPLARFVSGQLTSGMEPHYSLCRGGIAGGQRRPLKKEEMFAGHSPSRSRGLLTHYTRGLRIRRGPRNGKSLYTPGMRFCGVPAQEVML